MVFVGEWEKTSAEGAESQVVAFGVWEGDEHDLTVVYES